jgi:hypothetical protein
VHDVAVLFDYLCKVEIAINNRPAAEVETAWGLSQAGGLRGWYRPSMAFGGAGGLVFAAGPAMQSTGSSAPGDRKAYESAWLVSTAIRRNLQARNGRLSRNRCGPGGTAWLRPGQAGGWAARPGRKAEAESNLRPSGVVGRNDFSGVIHVYHFTDPVSKATRASAGAAAVSVRTSNRLTVALKPTVVRLGLRDY